MRSYSASESLRVYLAASVCAAHVNNGRAGFRQKDIRFYTDLFSNWMECQLGPNYQLQNTQIQRYVNSLVDEKILKKNQDLYYCQDGGLLSLIERIATINDDDPIELIYFQFHILKLYNELLFYSATEKKLSFPHSLTIELKYLLNATTLIEKQKLRIQKEIDKLKLRRDETLAMDKLSAKLLKENKPIPVIVKAIEQAYPYQLNNQMKMTSLFAKLPEKLQVAELTTNARARAMELWNPLVEHYEDHLRRLNKLIS